MEGEQQEAYEDYEGLRSFQCGQAPFSSGSVANPSLDEAALGTAAERRHFKEVAPAETPGDDAFEPESPLRKSCMKPPFSGEKLNVVFPWVSSILDHSICMLDLPMQRTTKPTGDVFPLLSEMACACR